jgi:hypothetical protein
MFTKREPTCGARRIVLAAESLEMGPGKAVSSAGLLSGGIQLPRDAGSLPTDRCAAASVEQGSRSATTHGETEKRYRTSSPVPFFCLAERVGFEPTKGYKPLLVFKTSAFNRSATSPASQLRAGIVLAAPSRFNTRRQISEPCPPVRVSIANRACVIVINHIKKNYEDIEIYNYL